MTESIQWHIDNPHLGGSPHCWICAHWSEIHGALKAAVSEATAPLVTALEECVAYRCDRECEGGCGACIARAALEATRKDKEVNP